MKRKALLILLVLTTIFSLSACSQSSTAPQTADAGKLEQTTFALGHLNSTAHLLGFVAAEEGFFKEEGLTVTLTQFASAGELVSGLESGKLDAAFIGSVPLITNQANAHDLTIFGGAMTNGHGYVIKSKYIPANFKEGDISVLKGRNVASVKNSVQDLELLVLLKNANIEIGTGPDKVNIVYFASQKDAFNALAVMKLTLLRYIRPMLLLLKCRAHRRLLLQRIGSLQRSALLPSGRADHRACRQAKYLHRF